MPTNNSNKAHHRKAKSACDYCRFKKAKCDEKKPCSNCVKRGLDCSYNPEEAQSVSKMDRAFMQLETKLDKLDSKLSILLEGTGAGDKGNDVSLLLSDIFGDSEQSTSSNLNAPLIKKAHENSKPNAKKINYNDMFSDDDLLVSFLDGSSSSESDLACKTSISDNEVVSTPINSVPIFTDSHPPHQFGKSFLDEIFDPDSKDPYMITFFQNYQDSFDYTNLFEPTGASNSSSSNFVMNISSLVDDDSSKDSNETDCFGIPTPSSTLGSKDTTTSSNEILLSTIQSTILKEDQHSIRGKLNLAFISNLKNLDLSPSYTEILFESYLAHIYPFYPIVCETTINEIIKPEVSKNGLVLSAATCEYFLVLALGEVAIADESHQYWSSESYKNTSSGTEKHEPPPGFAYFWSALSMIGKLKFVLPIGFDSITIQLLICVYYLKIGQLNDLKRELLEGSDMLFHFLELEGHKHTHRDILLRLYWVFLHLERSLFNMKLLDHSSSLLDIQPKVSIPRGCKSNFTKDADTFYSNCYMQNILLANIDDKARMMIVKIDKTVSLSECLRIFIKFEYELNTWRQLLPFSFQWEEDVSIRSTLVEMDLLKMKYYLSYVTVCQFMISKFEEVSNISGVYTEQLNKMVEKSLIFTIKAQLIFSRQHIVDLDPLSASTIMNSLYFVTQLMQLRKYASNQAFIGLDTSVKREFRTTKQKLQCFALHSSRMDDKLKTLEQSIIN